MATRALRVGAISNFLVTVPAFLAYDLYVGNMLDDMPNTPWLVWIWSGMAFLWGVMMWEIANNFKTKWWLLRYLVAEKAITSTSAVVGFVIGDLPGLALTALVITDVIWIPLFGLIFIEAQKQFQRTAA
ncbi:MAG: hypothetical protein ACSLFB_12765 [Acidimicrobiales bacterium]